MKSGISPAHALARALARYLPVAALAVLLTACASSESQPPESTSSSGFALAEPVTDVASLKAAAESAEGLAQPPAAGSPGDAQTPPEPTLYRGNDRQVRLPAPQDPVRLIGEDVSLNFEAAPLSEVMHAVLGDILGLDYIVDGPIKGEVTLRTRTPIPRDELLVILESLLKANGILLIRGSDGRFLVTGSQHATQLAPAVSSTSSTGAGFTTMIVPLRFISASNMAEILQPVAPESAFIRVDNARNLLMLAGTRAQLDGWLDLVRTFDVDLLAGMSVGLFPLENSNVQDVGEALMGLLNASGEQGLASLVRVIPVQRLNSILVVTPRSHFLDTVETWIDRLDSSPHSNYEKRLYVYAVENTSAGHLAELLTKIYSGGDGSSGGSGRGSIGGAGGGIQTGAPNTGVAPGMAIETIGGGGGEGGSSASASFGSSGGSGSATRRGGSTQAAALNMAQAMGGSADSAMNDVRVVADEQNNSLMIYATGRQFRVIKSALEQLDVVATQVIIEASILEVSLTDDLRYGLEWTFKNGLGDNYDGLGVLASAASGPAAVFPGFSYTVTNSVGDISAVLNALSEASLLNVISTPSVMVLDNHEAYIHVGEQVPVSLGSSVSDGGTATEQISYRDTGVKLTVKPSVNAGGLVTMDVAQSVTDLGEIEVSTLQRKFLERNIESRVAVRSNESVVLGGLIRERGATGSAGVPVLHRIPVFGALFGTENRESNRTELLVIITPRALYNESELREVSEEMRSRIRHMELLKLPEE